MKYEEVVNSPDGETWTKESLKKYKHMVDNDMFEILLRKDFQPGTKLVDST